MITVHSLKDEELKAIKEMDYMMWLSIQYHGDFSKENTMIAIDEKETVLGAGCLSFDSSWYATTKETMHNLTAEFVLKETLPKETAKEVRHKLMNKLKERFDSYQNEDKERKQCIQSFCESTDTDELQFYLDEGFTMETIIPVMKLELSTDISHTNLPANVTIVPLAKDLDTIHSYIHATSLSYEDGPDSERELLFRMGAKDLCCFTAVSNGAIVGGISVWGIDKQRAATENLFVIPKFRRQGIAKELMATAAAHLKQQGFTCATLSMLGTNRKAMDLYLERGYKLYYLLIRMQYQGK
ncbi:MAG: GNAT family N-acetyltransferase [bacterium]|nr:GNAT family N-acetyltransferase [bacterium]